MEDVGARPGRPSERVHMLARLVAAVSAAVLVVLLAPGPIAQLDHHACTKATSGVEHHHCKK